MEGGVGGEFFFKCLLSYSIALWCSFFLFLFKRARTSPSVYAHTHNNHDCLECLKQESWNSIIYDRGEEQSHTELLVGKTMRLWLELWEKGQNESNDKVERKFSRWWSRRWTVMKLQNHPRWTHLSGYLQLQHRGHDESLSTKSNQRSLHLSITLPCFSTVFQLVSAFVAWFGAMWTHVHDMRADVRTLIYGATATAAFLRSPLMSEAALHDSGAEPGETSLFIWLHLLAAARAEVEESGRERSRQSM